MVKSPLTIHTILFKILILFQSSGCPLINRVLVRSRLFHHSGKRKRNKTGD